MGNCNLRVIKYHDTYIFDRNCSLGFPLEGIGQRIVFRYLGQAQNQLPVAQAQV